MGERESNELGVAGTASFAALGGTIVFLLGLVVSALFGPVGLFFMVLGGATVLASPLIWVVMRWDGRSAEPPAT